MSPHESEQNSTMFGHVDIMPIQGGTFIQRNTQIIATSSEQGLGLLRQRASPASMHDAVDRDPPPTCAEGTRIKVIADIMKWINDPDPSERVLWVNGPFGNGKSAIMQKVAEGLSSDPKLKHLLAGSFFFGRGKPGRDKAEYLVPTIAYQIANNIPWMRKPIDAALSRDPTILDKSIRAQLRYLITEPFHLTLNSSPSQLGHQSCTPFHTPTVIIDGLDECEGRDSQRLIINAISDAVFKDQVKLRFLIASRPEPQIHELFLTQPLYQNYHPIVLVDDFATRAEILQYLLSGFDDICKRKRDLMYSVQKPWPSERDLRELTRRASGQFLYAATVLRFVGSDETHPVRQLEIILTRQHESVAAFSSMDELYSLILESCSSQETLPSLLQSLVFLHDNSHDLHDNSPFVKFWTQANVEVISGLRAGDISVILRGLSAVIAVKRVEKDEVPDDYSFQDFVRYYSPIISVHHQSFIEFLTDKARSRKFFIDTNTARQEIIDRLDALIVEWLSKRESSLGHSVHLSTLGLVQARFRRARIESTSWPRLQIFLHDPRKSWDPHPSKPSLERCNALSVVCGALRMQRDYFTSSDGMPSSQTLADTKKYLDVCTSIFDEEYLKVLSSVSTSAMWRIAGALSLPHVHEPHSGPISIVKLSQITGFSVQEIFGILDETGALHIPAR